MIRLPAPSMDAAGKATLRRFESGIHNLIMNAH
jgi:hypothetical protein